MKEDFIKNELVIYTGKENKKNLLFPGGMYRVKDPGITFEIYQTGGYTNYYGNFEKITDFRVGDTVVYIGRTYSQFTRDDSYSISHVYPKSIVLKEHAGVYSVENFRLINRPFKTADIVICIDNNNRINPNYFLEIGDKYAVQKVGSSTIRIHNNGIEKSYMKSRFILYKGTKSIPKKMFKREDTIVYNGGPYSSLCKGRIYQITSFRNDGRLILSGLNFNYSYDPKYFSSYAVMGEASLVSVPSAVGWVDPSETKYELVKEEELTSKTNNKNEGKTIKVPGLSVQVRRGKKFSGNPVSVGREKARIAESYLKDKARAVKS